MPDLSDELRSLAEYAASLQVHMATVPNNRATQAKRLEKIRRLEMALDKLADRVAQTKS